METSCSASNSHSGRSNISVSPEAKKIHDLIVENIRRLAPPDTNVVDHAFSVRYRAIMDLLEKYQKAVIKESEFRIACAKGCSTCCFHWVEDVYSFEAQMIGQYIRENMPRDMERIKKTCREDEKLLTILQEAVDDKIQENFQEIEKEGIDSVDLLLASFYQLKRPCPLLSAGGECSIYPVRPLTCRIYVNLSDPRFCDPRYIHDDDIRTYLLDMEEDANSMLDDIHSRFDIYNGDTGLRSLLIKCLR